MCIMCTGSRQSSLPAGFRQLALKGSASAGHDCSESQIQVPAAEFPEDPSEGPGAECLGCCTSILYGVESIVDIPALKLVLQQSCGK